MRRCLGRQQIRLTLPLSSRQGACGGTAENLRRRVHSRGLDEGHFTTNNIGAFEVFNMRLQPGHANNVGLKWSGLDKIILLRLG
jgi:hypothetical protein